MEPEYPYEEGSDDVLEGRDEVIPSCVYLTGQYGIQDVFCGVPVRLGRQGVAEILELDLSKEEKKALQESAEKVRENCLKLSL